MNGALSCFVEIEVDPAAEPGKNYQLPWTPALEGKTIVGVETYIENGDGTSFEGGLPAFVAPSFTLVFKDKAKKELLTIPYVALAQVGLYQQNLSPGPGVQPRQLKPRFSFVFSSRDTYIRNNNLIAMPYPQSKAYLCFKYLP